jgi:hypothetical protein
MYGHICKHLVGTGEAGEDSWNEITERSGAT